MFGFKKFDYDLIVIGSGSGGSVGAHFAADLGKKVAVFEKAEIGGECPNFACVPTKALLHAGKTLEVVKNSSTFGIKVKGIEIDYPAVHKYRELVVSRTGAKHGEESFKHDNINLIKMKARFINSHEIEAGGKIYSARKYLLATGSTSFIPPIDGILDAGYLTFKEAVSLVSLPESILILGGGPIGCEFAQIFATFGVKVTIIEHSESLLSKEDPEICDLVRALFEYKGIKVITDANLLEVTKSKKSKVAKYQHGDKHYLLNIDEVLIASGKKPVLDFDPEKAGLEISDGKLKVNKFLQTNVSHIYGAGDVVGPYMFTHTGYYQSYLAVKNMFTANKEAANYSTVPKCVFIDPEVASVGLTEKEANSKGIKTKKGIAPIAILGRANTSNLFDGFIKIITDKNGLVLGGAIVAPHAGEIIHTIALAIKLKVKSELLSKMIFAYPTYSEAIKIACSNLK